MLRPIKALECDEFPVPTEALLELKEGLVATEPAIEQGLKVPSVLPPPSTSAFNSRARRTCAFGFLADAMKDNLYALRGGRLIYTTPWIKQGLLRPISASILITAWRKPFHVMFREAGERYQAVAVRPMIERGVQADNAGMLAFRFDPSHPEFPRFRRLPVPGVLTLERSQFEKYDEAFEAAYRGQLTNEAASELFDRVAAVALPCFPRTRPIDRRITRVMTLLWDNHRYPLAELAAAVGVSYYRLSHLFAENIGISLRSYQQWRKMRKALSLSRHGYTLTKIAHDAGFTDSAHFSRVFQQLYAAPPSYFFHSGNVRIIGPAFRSGNVRGEAGTSP